MPPQPRKKSGPKVLGFGEVCVALEFLANKRLLDLFTNQLTINVDTLISLIIFLMVSEEPGSQALAWWNSTVAKGYFPKAQLEPENIDELLNALGSKYLYRRHLAQHIKYIQPLTAPKYILLDGLGQPNYQNLSGLTPLSNDLTTPNRTRVTLALDQKTGLPIYYGYLTADLASELALPMIVNELSEYKIPLDFAYLGADGYSKESLIQLYNDKIPFVTTSLDQLLDPSLLTKDHFGAAKGPKAKAAAKGPQSPFKGLIKEVPVSVLDGRKAFAYLSDDLDALHKYELTQLKLKFFESDNFPFTEGGKNFGDFFLLSSFKIKNNEIISYYTVRKRLEKFFNYLRAGDSLYPEKAPSDLAVKGYFLLSFMALTANYLFQSYLLDLKLDPKTTISNLRSIKCQELDREIIPDPLSKDNEKLFKALNIPLPQALSHKELKVF
ncbi:MAG: hypothetical protein LBS60_15520 [Deltaproteobacteria bacterium]|jgi:hypothetical protein|nr:hypothetical protein [Deltaproteobacteria bacterium]